VLSIRQKKSLTGINVVDLPFVPLKLTGNLKPRASNPCRTAKLVVQKGARIWGRKCDFGKHFWIWVLACSLSRRSLFFCVYDKKKYLYIYIYIYERER